MMAVRADLLEEGTFEQRYDKWELVSLRILEAEQSRQRELCKQKPGGWSMPGAL